MSSKKDKHAPAATDTVALVALRARAVEQFQATIAAANQAQSRALFLRGAITAYNEQLHAAGVDLTTLDKAPAA